MSVYKYLAADTSGHTRKGILHGDSPQHIRQQLHDLDLTLIELTTVDKSGDGNIFQRRKKVSMSMLALLTYQLGTLLSAGLTVEAALQNIAEQMDQNFIKTMLLTVRTRVLEGYSLAYGMNEFPEVFPNLYRATIAAGDKSGQLDQVINLLSVYLEAQENIRQKIHQALIYPSLLLFVCLGIITFLLVYAMPKITKVFTESGQALPGLTQFLLSFSAAIKNGGLYVLLILIIGIFTFRYFMKRESFKFKVQSYLLKIPLIGQTLTIVNAARFSRTFGILYAASVPVEEAMRTANSVVTLLPMRAAIDTAILHVVEGMSIHQALAQTGYFTKLSTQLISSGETSGQLEQMLEKAASFQEKQVARWIATTLALFEPAMILLMGGVVLFIVLAILLPVFQMNELS